MLCTPQRNRPSPSFFSPSPIIPTFISGNGGNFSDMAPRAPRQPRKPLLASSRPVRKTQLTGAAGGNRSGSRASPKPCQPNSLNESHGLSAGNDGSRRESASAGADSNNTTGTAVSCSNCDGLQARIHEQEKEMDHLKTLFNEAKGRISREECLVNQLSESNKKSAHSIMTLETRNAALSARVKAIEQAIPTGKQGKRGLPKSNNHKNKPFSQMKKAELMINVHHVPEKYQALCLAVRENASPVVFDEISESCLKSVDGVSEPTRVHDWSEKFEKNDNISEDALPGRAPLHLPDVDHATGVPISPLKIAENGFFSPKGDFPNMLIKEALWRTVRTNDEFSRFKGEGEWEASLAAIQADPATQAYFTRVANASLSNRNREAKVHFFTSLGYDLFSHRSKLSDSERAFEKSHIRSLCNGKEEAENIDTTFWRRLTWQELFNPARELPEEPPISEIDGDGVDLLFRNNAAKSAFISFLNYVPGTDETIMSIARADAWFTTCLMLVSLPDGKGGKRNSQFRDMFMNLLPRCTSNVLGTMHRVILREGPGELVKNSSSCYIPSLEQPTQTHFELKIGQRDLTDIVFMPSDQCYYIYVKKTAIKRHLCCWISFADAYIAKASDCDSEFQALGECDRDVQPTPSQYSDTPVSPTANVTENAARVSPFPRVPLKRRFDDLPSGLKRVRPNLEQEVFEAGAVEEYGEIGYESPCNDNQGEDMANSGGYED